MRTGWFEELKNDFREAKGAARLSIIADIVSIVGVSSLTVLSAAMAQIRQQQQVDLFGILMLVAAAVTVVVMVTATLGAWMVFFALLYRTCGKNLVTNIIYYGIMVVIVLFAFSLVLFFGPMAIDSLLAGP